MSVTICEIVEGKNFNNEAIVPDKMKPIEEMIKENESRCKKKLLWGANTQKNLIIIIYLKLFFFLRIEKGPWPILTHLPSSLYTLHDNIYIIKFVKSNIDYKLIKWNGDDLFDMGQGFCHLFHDYNLKLAHLIVYLMSYYLKFLKELT
jgi:hypothetical protein